MEGMLNTKNKNKGQVLVLVALSLVVFIGFAALAIDVAYFYHTKHQLQGAADAGALAGAAFVSCKDDTGSNFSNLTTAKTEAWKFACNNLAAGSKVYLETKGSEDCTSPPSASALNFSNYSSGDIVVGHWTGSQFVPADGTTGNVLNAVKVRPRRVDAIEGMPKVNTFFGKIFGVDKVSIRSAAVAQGCLGLAPISINEYWSGDDGLTGPPACKDPANSDPGRGPYGIHHVYPNSFVRPPCDTPGANRCADPPKGNVLTTAFPNFKTQDCKTPPNTISVKNNGPLPVPCAGVEECKGRPAGMRTVGRVFAVVGGAAYPNDPGSNMHSLLNLDERIGYSQPTIGEQWYKVDGGTFAPNSPNKANADTYKSTIAGYIRNGRYPNALPTSRTERYQPGYIAMSTYTSSQPFASVSFISGQGVTGQMVNSNFYDNGSYSGGKYAPGNKIIVTVYDGVKGGGGNQERTTIVAFARVTIFGYGNRLSLDSNGYPSVSGPQNTLYGYIESADDLKQNFSDFFMPGPAMLVQ